jgi:hypothetical protein
LESQSQGLLEPALPGGSMKKVLVALCVVGSVSVPLRAELKYTMHVEVKKGEAPAGQPVNPTIAMMGDSMIKEMLPAGSVDLVYIIGERGTRVEYLQPAMGQAAGTYNLALPDGTMYVVNPKDQTYAKTSVQGAAAAMKAHGVTPTTTVKRTGEFGTVLDIRCEIVTFDWKMDIPIPEAVRASLPPDFPLAILMNGDTCVTTDQFTKYVELAAKSPVNDLMSNLGLKEVLQGGIAMRQTVRFGTVELLSTVTQLGEEDVPASAFELPAGYKEVPAPTGIK